MPKRTISSGESIPSIARDEGFFWKTLWELPENAELREKRKDPNVLYEGDEVEVPELREKEESRATEQTHTFRRKGDPLKLKLKLMLMDEPRSNEDFTLDVDGKLITGSTDADGKLEEWIPGNARRATLIMGGGREKYPIHISRLDPVDTTPGAKQRLANLGYACSDDDEISAQDAQAICEFQRKYKLEETGQFDEPTLAKIKEFYQ